MSRSSICFEGEAICPFVKEACLALKGVLDIIAKLNVNRGTLSVGNASSSAKPAIYDNVNISVEDFSFTSPFSFKMTAQLPGSGDVKISGKGGPINVADAIKTPLATTIKVNNMNIGALGFIALALVLSGVPGTPGTARALTRSVKISGA